MGCRHRSAWTGASQQPTFSGARWCLRAFLLTGAGYGYGCRAPSASCQQPKNQPTPPNVMPPIAPRRRPFRPQFTYAYLFRLVLMRSRGPSESQASHFLANLALLVPPEALCSPATSPKFYYGARLAPATGGAPATFSAAAARLPQQSSRRVPGGGFNLRPAPLSIGGRVALQSYSNHAWQT
jgi:hypothetical protein